MCRPIYRDPKKASKPCTSLSTITSVSISTSEHLFINSAFICLTALAWVCMYNNPTLVLTVVMPINSRNQHFLDWQYQGTQQNKHTATPTLAPPTSGWTWTWRGFWVPFLEPMTQDVVRYVKCFPATMAEAESSVSAHRARWLVDDREQTETERWQDQAADLSSHSAAACQTHCHSTLSDIVSRWVWVHGMDN